MLKKFRSTTQVCLALLLSLFSTNILPVAVAYADQPADNGVKVFVCKYVGTPNVNETLQTGTNPISVSSSSTGGTAVGSYFADQQGQSFVLAIDNTAPGPAGDPNSSACPPPRGPIPVPSVPVIDPCGLANAIYGVVPSGNYTFVVNPDGSITFTTNTGFVFTGNLASVTLPAPTDSGTLCPVIPITIPVPTVPVTDPCGPANAVYGTVPTGNYSVQLNVDGSITLTASVGFVFTGGLLSVTLPVPTDSGAACPVDVCPNLDGLQITVPQGMEINNDGNCVDKKITICHRTNAVVNPYNKISVSTNAADGIAGNSGGQPDHFGEHTGPIFDPETMENGDDWGDIIPPIEGVHDGLNWSELGQAIYRNDCNMPDDNEGEPDLSFDYDSVCTDEEQTEGEASVEIDNEGNAAANDLTVNLYDENNVLIDTQIVDVPANQDVEAAFTGLAQGMYTIKVYDGDTLLSTGEVEVDECGGGFIDVCPNIDGIQFVIPDSLVKDDSGNCVSDKCPLVPGVQTDTTLCPAGSGGGNVLTDTATTTRVLPATLPATGGEANLLAVVFAMITAYGATYFLQGRRQLSLSALEK